MSKTKTIKNKVICQECGMELTSCADLHTIKDCGEHHYKRAKEILKLSDVVTDTKLLETISTQMEKIEKLRNQVEAAKTNNLFVKELNQKFIENRTCVWSDHCKQPFEKCVSCEHFATVRIQAAFLVEVLSQRKSKSAQNSGETTK